MEGGAIFASEGKVQVVAPRIGGDPFLVCPVPEDCRHEIGVEGWKMPGGEDVHGGDGEPTLGIR